ncbi:hypothetical protein ACHAW5_009272 [Stephanodiscus triporus]|uniref:Uncharacterized protein n=1 Tax=Stephanodiscus triporus TaxID=2934178 RepID=A0ABD3N351_9STRA
MGKLRGIVLTPELRSVIDAVLALPQKQHQEPSRAGGANDDDGCPGKTTTTTTTTTSMSPERAARGARRELSTRGTSRSNDAGEAKSAVRSATSSSSATLSLSALEPIRFLIDNSLNDSSHDGIRTTLLLELEGAIRKSSLSFAPDDDSNDKSPDDGLPTSAPSDVDVDRTAFEKRLAKLRLRDEERSYGRLTTNLRNRSSMIGDDDVTAKSMTYAASVGLNMIVAPVTFGVFMYFFAGGIFGRFFDDDDDDVYGDRRHPRGGGVDVRRVIAGVISGCFMLFVEMILFVIRSHEIDASSTRKGRRSENRANPFGYTQKSMARVYVRVD